MDNERVIHGRTITPAEIEAVKALIREHPDWSRRRLSREVCAFWDWRNAKGELRDMACRTVLLRLHRGGELELPAPRQGDTCNRHRPTGEVAHDTSPIKLPLHELTPLDVSIPPPRSADAAMFKFLLQRYHYLGLRHVPGENMAYLIRDAGGREVACLLFAAAAWKVTDRDHFIGWPDSARETNLSFVTNNVRFLVLPWVEVKNLASHVLALVCRRIREDWIAKYGHPVHLLETFVERSRFRGVCYQAANWRPAGRTVGRTRNDRQKNIRASVKDVYVYPLTGDFRQVLGAAAPRIGRGGGQMISYEQALEICRANPENGARLICELSAKVDAQQRQIDMLQKKVTELERMVARLSKNSSNSGKPPSSDITKPKAKSGKKGKGKGRIGAQHGHQKHERSPFPENDINDFYDYRFNACPECDNPDVTFLDQPPRVIQQMELEETIVRKEEHRAYPVWCDRCQKVHYHPFPEAVVKEGLFKERLTALVAYMKAVDHASFSTIRKYVRDVMGEKVSRGYLRKVVAKVSDALDAPYDELLNRLPLESTLNVDETGHKENGDKFWTWVFRADLYVLFKIDKSRGSKVLINVLGEEFDGVLGCDYFSAYHKYMKDFNITVQFCVAHLIRDIKYLVGLKDPETKAYGKKLLAKVKAMFKVIHEREHLTPDAFDETMEQAREAIMDVALNDAPSSLDKNGRELKREAFNMAKRFRDNGKAYFEFITTPGMAPTNNLAEQAVRFVVIDRRITQGTRSRKGRETNERLWTVVGTCSLQGRSAFEFILAAVRAHFRGDPAPSLLSAFG